jgi:pentatricopeptide repeat protein
MIVARSLFLSAVRAAARPQSSLPRKQMMHNARKSVQWTLSKIQTCSFSTETTTAEQEASAAKKKNKNKTAEGGADRDIRPMNKQLRDYVNAGEYEKARQLFTEMREKGPKPNVVSYNVMLTCGREQKDWDYVKTVQEEMDLRFPEKKKPSKPAKGEAGDAPKAPKPREYSPKYRSGPFALLVALHRAGSDAGISKDDLMGAAQPLCDVSFTIPVRQFEITHPVVGRSVRD